jgi:hypothetical protein
MRPIRAISIAGLLLGAFAVGGCAEGGLAANLRSAGVGGSPDEFLVLPTRPLEMPTDLRTLPPPAPGTVNRVDYRPHSEAIAGLTGRTGPVGTASGAPLVARVGAANPEIRVQLAVEDVEWRRTHRGRLLERWFSRDQDALVYRQQALPAPSEFDRMRASGLRVPPAPPAVLQEE